MNFAIKYLIPGALTASLLFSCKDKQPGSGDVDSGNPVKDVMEKVLPTGDQTLNQRSQALGFAQHLPKDTECVIAFYRGKELTDQIRGSKLGKWLEARSADEGINLEEMEENPQAQQIGKLFAEESLIAFGRNTGKQANVLLQAANESSYISMRSVLAELARATGAEASDPEELIMGRVDQYLTLLEGAEMPPLTIALKGGKQASEELLPMLMSQLDTLREQSPTPEMVTEISFERAGASFTGLQLNGEEVAKMAKSEMDGSVPLSPEQMEKALALVSQRNLVVAAGVLGDYLVVMAGPSIDGCQLVEQAADSVLADDAFRFVDQYTDKPILGAIFASQELQQDFMNGYSGYAAYVSAIQDGLKEVPAFGDTRDLMLLLDRVLEQEQGIREEITYSDMGAIAFLEDGLKLESFGGMNYPTLDSKSPREFAPMSQTDDLFLFANWIGDEEMAQKQGEMFDTFGEIVWLLANKATQMDVEMPELDQFKGVFGMINSQYGEEIDLAVKALRGDLPQGFGGEGAVVIDLKGQVPSGIPMVPPVLVENGKLPRVIYAQKVKDREKLAAAWDGLEQVAKSVLKKTESGITMPSFLTSEKDGLVSYFYPFPFQTDDFLLNLTVGDEIFFLSSSKTFVYELNGRYAAGPSDASKTGAVVEIHLDVLRRYAEEWLNLVEDNADEVFPSEVQAEDFMANKDMIREFIETIEGVERFDFHMREESGLPRTSLHLKIN